MDDRRFAELCELLLDGELETAEAAELRAHLEVEPGAVANLRSSARDHLLCRAALRPADPARLAALTGALLDARRPSLQQGAARAVLARIDRRRRWARARSWGAVAAAALLLVLLVPQMRQLFQGPVLPPDRAAPVLSDVRGEVRLGTGRLLVEGEPIPPEAVVVSGPAAQATLVFADGTRIALAADTRVVRLPGGGERVGLELGSVAVRAAHRPAEQALEIVCPDAVARVVGTAFSAAVSDGRSRLEVSEGLVRWQRTADGAVSLVGAGQQVEAAALPLARPLLLANGQLAAVRAMIAAGREPWAGCWVSLRTQAAVWRTQPPADVAVIEVPSYGSPGPGHSGARVRLFAVTRSLLGLALVARLGSDAEAAAAARVRLRAATRLVLTGADADVLACDMLAVYGLQAADLLRQLPGWTQADSDLIGQWIANELAPRAARLARLAPLNMRLRGLVATMAIAAWRGEAAGVRTTMAEVSAGIADQLSPTRLAALLAAPEADQQLFQILAHALLCADLARVAGDDDAPPPTAWAQAVTSYLRIIPPGAADSQPTFLFRALVGPGPWRTPVAAGRFQGVDPPEAGYGWYFPTLVAHDPRWDEAAGTR